VVRAPSPTPPAETDRDAGQLRARAERAERRVATLEQALAELRGPGLRRDGAPRGLVFAALGLIAVLGIAGVLFVVESGAPARAQREIEDVRGQLAQRDGQLAEADRRLRELDAQLAEAARQRSDAEARAADAERRARELEVGAAAAPPEPIPQLPLPRGDFTPVTATARVRRVTGAAPVTTGAHCTVAISPASRGCRAQVRCGAVELYPHPGHGGYFSCTSDASGPLVGRDVNTTSVSGDPTLDLDYPRRRLAIGDDRWSADLGIDR
jgi:hypothetical protein